MIENSADPSYYPLFNLLPEANGHFLAEPVWILYIDLAFIELFETTPSPNVGFGLDNCFIYAIF